MPGQRNLYLERSLGQVGPRKFRRAADRTESKAAQEDGKKAGLSTLAHKLYFVFAKSPSKGAGQLFHFTTVTAGSLRTEGLILAHCLRLQVCHVSP